MPDILFPTDTASKATPTTSDIILLADVADSNNPKDATLWSLPISTATQTALNAKQGNLTLTTTGSSWPATLIGDTLNIPQYSGGGGVTDHWALTGLADDDHTQYSLVSGTRAFTGKVSYSSHPTFSADTELVDKKYVDDAIIWGGGYTDEQAQDAVGTILADSGRIDFTYNDATPSITADIIDDSVTFAKMQNISVNRVLGRSTAWTGDIEQIQTSDMPNFIGLWPSFSPEFAWVNIGHPTDTTITRVSAWQIAVEGVTVPLNSTTNTHTAQQIELGNASDTTLSRSSAWVLAVEWVVVPTISSTNTLTNKRITKRVTTEASSATPTINTDNSDMHRITALAAAITSFTTNLTGTPTDWQTLWISITDNGTARSITWWASFEASTVSLPTTTVISTRLDVGFVWNTVTSRWRCIAVA